MTFYIIVFAVNDISNTLY